MCESGEHVEVLVLRVCVDCCLDGSRELLVRRVSFSVMVPRYLWGCSFENLFMVGV